MLRLESLIRFASIYALRFVGSWYKWGGDDPSGFDCSGFVNEILQAVGIIGRKEDLTADELYKKFQKYKTSYPSAGCLAFWGTEEKKTHVEYCLNSYLSIGASGGGRNILTVEDAIKANAFIKVRPVFTRGGKIWFVDPFVRKENE